MADAAGLAAIVAAGETERELDAVVPLGIRAVFEYLAPARGRLVALTRMPVLGGATP
jgi:hypothetical protein